jgi:hypothetical protein
MAQSKKTSKTPIAEKTTASAAKSLLEQAAESIRHAETLALAGACAALESARTSPVQARPACQWDRWSEESNQRASFEWRAPCPAETEGSMRFDSLYHSAYEEAHGRPCRDLARYESALEAMGLSSQRHDLHRLASLTADSIEQFSKAAQLLQTLGLFDDFWQAIKNCEGRHLDPRSILLGMGRIDALPYAEQALMDQSTLPARATRTKQSL